MNTKLPYREGALFFVPLRTSGLGRGLISRMPVGGRALVGYFFGPKINSKEEGEFKDISPQKSLFCVRFGDLGLINGEWDVFGQAPNWNRDEWPTPDFVRRDPIMKRATLVRYSDRNPLQVELEQPIEFDADLPSDSLYGYGAVELRLTNLLG